MEQVFPSMKKMQDDMFTLLKKCHVCEGHDWILKCGICSTSIRVCCMGCLLWKVNNQILDMDKPWTNFCNICKDFKHHDADRSMYYLSRIIERDPSDRYITARKKERRRLKLLIRKYNKIVRPAVLDRKRTYRAYERTNKRSWKWGKKTSLKGINV